MSEREGSKSIFCSRCGAMMDYEAQFCHVCGAENPLSNRNEELVNHSEELVNHSENKVIKVVKARMTFTVYSIFINGIICLFFITLLPSLIAAVLDMGNSRKDMLREDMLNILPVLLLVCMVEVFVQYLVNQRAELSVYENKVFGVAALMGGHSAKTVECNYEEIIKATADMFGLRLETKKGKYLFCVQDAPEIAQLINEKINGHGKLL